MMMIECGGFDNVAAEYPKLIVSCVGGMVVSTVTVNNDD